MRLYHVVVGQRKSQAFVTQDEAQEVLDHLPARARAQATITSREATPAERVDYRLQLLGHVFGPDAEALMAREAESIARHEYWAERADSQELRKVRRMYADALTQGSR